MLEAEAFAAEIVARDDVEGRFFATALSTYALEVN